MVSWLLWYTNIQKAKSNAVHYALGLRYKALSHTYKVVKKVNPDKDLILIKSSLRQSRQSRTLTGFDCILSFLVLHFPCCLNCGRLRSCLVLWHAYTLYRWLKCQDFTEKAKTRPPFFGAKTSSKLSYPGNRVSLRSATSNLYLSNSMATSAFCLSGRYDADLSINVHTFHSATFSATSLFFLLSPSILFRLRTCQHRSC